MKLNQIKKQAGLTLIEITLVIAVLLGLISVLFIGVSAYREGSNRAKCILNISSVQKAVRSYANLYELEIGEPLAIGTIAGTATTPDATKLLAVTPECPSEGTYAFGANVPAIGTAYLTCTATGHAPSAEALASW